MTDQWTTDWDSRFKDGDTPWEEDGPCPGLARIASEYLQPGSSLMEVGCGLGTNAIWLAQQGFSVTATDISSEAIQLARSRMPIKSPSLEFEVVNFIDDTIDQRYDVLFDKGCLHSFNTDHGLEAFVEKASSILEPGSIWVSISGNADTLEDLDERREFGFPRLSATKVVSLVEPYFEVLEIRSSKFGLKNDFKSWECVFRRRAETL